MSVTDKLKLPYIADTQALKHITHNEALQALDTLIQLSVTERNLSTPPSSPGVSERFIVALGATNAWVGKEDQIAAWQNGAWVFYTPENGWIVWVEDENTLLAWSGSAWEDAALNSVNPIALVGVNATADPSNRLTVSSPASLFNHEGSDHRQNINKNAAGDTASVVFQTGYSGRAEFGTTGDDNFHVKVSPDGSSWKEALVISKDSGEISVSKLTCSASAIDEIPLIVEAASGHTAQIMQIKNKDGNVSFWVRNDGLVVSEHGLQLLGAFYPGFIGMASGNLAMRSVDASILVGSESKLQFMDLEDGGTVSSELQFDAVGELGLRNASSEQKLNIYETTDGALDNYSRGYLSANSGGNFEIGTEALGTGTRRDIVLDGANRATKISDPSGGATIDSEARAAINAIIDVLESFGLSANS